MERYYSYDNQGYILGYVYSYYDTSEGWVENSKMEYAYDENGNTILAAYYRKNNGEWVGSYKNEYKYKDVNGEIKTVKYAYYSGWDYTINDWQGSYYSEYDYDDNGRQTLYTYQSGWDEENHCWASGSKYEYAHDNDFGYRTLYVSYNWDSSSSSWQGYTKQETEYDNNGNQTLYISYSWDSSTSSWQEFYKQLTEYDTVNNTTSHVYYEQIDNELIKTFAEIFKYNEKGYTEAHTYCYYDSNGNETDRDEYTYENTYDEKTGLLLESVEQRNGENYFKEIYQYDEQTQNVILYKNYYLNDGVWVDNNKTEYAYDSNGNNILEQSFRWDSSSNKWIGDWKYKAEYVTINGSQYQTLYEYNAGYDSNDNWIGRSKNEYGYDEYGNTIKNISYTWDYDNAQWIYSTKSENEYSSNGYANTYYQWDNSAQKWVGIYKYGGEYNAQGYQTLYISYSWDDENDNWYVTNKTIYDNDSEGHPTLCATYSWDDTTNELVGDYKCTYEWDSMGTLTLRNFYEWDTSSKDFILAWTYEFEYNQDGLLSKDYCYTYTNGTDKYLDSINTYYYSLHDISAIESVNTDATGNSQIQIFDMQGRPRTSLAKGINIVKSNGKTIKVVK